MANSPSSMEVLTKIRVAKTCPADWREMQGDNRVRHCSHCSRNVYNLSEMSREEAAELIRKSEGRVCSRFYARPDGTMMVRDCGQGTRKRTAFAGVAIALAAAVGITCSLGASPAATGYGGSSSMRSFDSLLDKIRGLVGLPPRYGMTMGDVAYMPPAPPTKSSPPSSSVTHAPVGKKTSSTKKGS